jgi:hypothetical protein
MSEPGELHSNLCLSRGLAFVVDPSSMVFALQTGERDLAFCDMSIETAAYLKQHLEYIDAIRRMELLR